MQGSLFFHLRGRGGREIITKWWHLGKVFKNWCLEMQLSIIYPPNFRKKCLIFMNFCKNCPGRYLKVMKEWRSLIVPVLAYVQSLPTTGISLQLLTFKTLFLTIYSSISRVSSVARLGPSLQEHRDSVVLHFVSLEKQARVGNTRGYLQIPRFPEDPELCPVRTLITYFNKVTSNNFWFLRLYTCLFSGVWNSWRLWLFLCVLCGTPQERDQQDLVKVD